MDSFHLLRTDVHKLMFIKLSTVTTGELHTYVIVLWVVATVLPPPEVVRMYFMRVCACMDVREADFQQPSAFPFVKK